MEIFVQHFITNCFTFPTLLIPKALDKHFSPPRRTVDDEGKYIFMLLSH